MEKDMSAEVGPLQDVSFSSESAIERWLDAEEVASPAEVRGEAARATVAQKRYQDLERRYQELYAVYESVVSEQSEEKTHLLRERDQADEECARLKEELRLLHEGRTHSMPLSLVQLDETLKRIRRAEAELAGRVEQVRAENQALSTALAVSRQGEMRAQLEQARTESRLKTIAEVLLGHCVELESAKNALTGSIASMQSLLNPIEGELKRSESELAEGLLRDLKQELELLRGVQSKMENLSRQTAHVDQV